MNYELMTILLFATMGILLIIGFPMAFTLISASLIFTILLWSTDALSLVMMTVYSLWDTIILLAVPLFILMGTLLEQSGLAEDLYTFMHGIFGRLRGGLAIGTDIICTIFAAMTGISGAATVTMGIVALPAMLKRGYSKTLAIGCIAGGGALGILIPPSIVMVVFALFAEESVGKLFIGGILPGLMLSGMFIAYIAIRAYLQPNLAPALEKGEAYHPKQILTAARGLILPFLVIILVLGSIFTGIATPTEAAAVGAFGMFIAAFVRGKFSYAKLKKALLSAFNVSAMMFWIIIGGQLFTSVYIALGATEFVKGLLIGSEMNRWLILIFLMLTLFVLGCVMDPMGIVMITTPIYVPVIRALGFDPVWYGILFTMNMEMAYLTPPYGSNLFYLKGVAPPGVTMSDIYRAVWPFVGIQATALALVMIFPQIALILPQLAFGHK